jgi:hypothetical protein
VESVTELQAREKELAREWQWLVDVLNKVARARALGQGAEAGLQPEGGIGAIIGDQNKKRTQCCMAVDGRERGKPQLGARELRRLVTRLCLRHARVIRRAHQDGQTQLIMRALLRNAATHSHDVAAPSGDSRRHNFSATNAGQAGMLELGNTGADVYFRVDLPSPVTPKRVT